MQYATFVTNLASGHWGTDLSGRPIADELAARFAITARLTLVAITAEVILGIGAGVLAALRRSRFVDAVVTVSTLTLLAIPVMVLSPLAQWVVAVQWGWLPVTSGADPGWGALLLPGLVLGSASMAYVTRLVRTAVVDGRHTDFARTAHAKGLTTRRVLTAHVMRPALAPVVTFIGVEIGTLLAGAVVTERVFNIPGVGSYLVEGIQERDSTAVVTTVTVLVLIFCLVNAIVDVLYGALDPRVADARR